jgi:hypothetical protein
LGIGQGHVHGFEHQPERRLARANDNVIDLKETVLALDGDMKARIVDLLVLNAAANA